MTAYGSINDGERVIAWVNKGEVRANTPKGEVVGTEKDGDLFDLDGKHVGHLATSGPATVKAWWPETR